MRLHEADIRMDVRQATRSVSVRSSNLIAVEVAPADLGRVVLICNHADLRLAVVATVVDPFEKVTER